jgi:hypothetical protein
LTDLRPSKKINKKITTIKKRQTQKNNKSKKYKHAKKTSGKHMPNRRFRKEMEKQIGCAMLNLRDKRGKMLSN